MSNTNTGGPAFPTPLPREDCPRMTLRQYAAIKLKVPESGTDWLDEMIRKSQRDDLAAEAMSVQPWFDPCDTYSNHADRCYEMADRMQKASEE